MPAHEKRCDTVVSGGGAEFTYQTQGDTAEDEAARQIRRRPRNLQKATRYHSTEMIKKDYFRREPYNSKAFNARLKHFSYDWFALGENIAWETNS